MKRRMMRDGNPGWAVVLVFGWLFLRALVPAGFMLASVDGSPTLVVCDAEMAAGAHQHEHHHHQHPGADPVGHRQAAHGDPTCPYAQSAGSAPLPTLPVLAGGAVYDVFVSPVPVTRSFASSGPVRQQTSRGPPYLA